MKTLFSYQSILVLSGITIFTGCIGNCPTNYTSTIRSIMQPMKKNLQDFFIQEQTYPNDTQRNTLLEASGCKIINAEQRTCKYKGLTLTYDSNKGILYPESKQTSIDTDKKLYHTVTDVTPQEPTPTKGQEIYTFAIVKEDSLCTMDMTTNGKILPIKCIQHSCLKIDP